MIAMTTDVVSPAERVDYWTDLISRNVTPMRMERSKRAAFRGEVRAKVIGDVTVAEVSGCGILASHASLQVAQTREHLIAACVHLDGEARISRRGEHISFLPGDVFITDSREKFTLDLERPWRQLVLSMPTHLIDSRVARPELIAGVVLRGQPLVRLWADYLVNGFGAADSLSPTAANLFATHSVELLTQALSECGSDRPATSDSWRAAMFARACRVIDFRFADSRLSPELIARELCVSVRTLSRIFAANNDTVMRRIIDTRVQRAKTLLSNPQAANRSISAIAFGCGFSDVSHFGRFFAERVGMTPSEWRQSTGRSE